MASLRQKILRAWDGNETSGPFLALLSFSSAIYSLALGFRNSFYDSGLGVKKLGCKVISVGNITVGGTGKTPTAIMIAGLLRENGWRPAVLSRGYGGSRRDINLVSDGERVYGCAYEAGDEPLLIARSLAGVPVVTSPDRYEAGLLAVGKLGANVVVLDDGFQHRRLQRDIDIVLLDSEKPFGNGFLLPRGPLREGPGSLERADVIILTRSGSAPDSTEAKLKRDFPAKIIVRARHEPEGVVDCATGAAHPVSFLRGKKVAAFCGIARPESFRRLIEEQGGDMVFFEIYGDHHPYTPADLEHLEKKARAAGADLVLTTEKDFTRIETRALPGLFTLKIRVSVEDADFPQWLLARLAR